MVLANPGRMHPELISVQRFRSNVRDERVGIPRIIFVVIVAQSEVTELHRVLLKCFSFDG
jgi:hypothetical protein